MKNIFYIPGMISITGLLLVLKFNTVPRFMPVKNETVIKHMIPSEDRNQMFSGYQLIDQTIKKKKIIHVDLTGDSEEDDKKTFFIQTEARRIKYTHDTASIIEIHLSDEINFGRFAELVNIMLKDKHKKYCLWNNNFYIFSEPLPQPIQPETIHPIYL